MTISGYKLDEEQLKIVYDDSKNMLVVAGAGSGKTLTILGKINYLINEQNISPKEIICISFTKAASESLKNKIKKEFSLDMEVYTFHKLALNILKNKYNIADPNTLEYIIDDFFKYKQVDKYIKKISTKELENLKKLLSTFIHLFKCNNYKLNDFNTFLKQIRKLFNFDYKKEKNFLTMALNIYLQYEKYLKENNEIDFDDMIILATKKVQKSFNKKVKYIIIDEYQDTSLIRFNLIKSIIDKTNSNLLVVGDDFQSIYRFTGCDINLFLNFKQYFNDSKILKIQSTYRNSNELIKISGDFVMKNKKQIRKTLTSKKHLKNPIKIYNYNSPKSDFKKLLKIVYKSDKELLVIGRNNNDIFNYIDKDFKYKNGLYIYENIKFKYMTVHKSKGLESDNVIIINMNDDILGFPSKIKQNKILRLVQKYDKYPYSEERRLFYVALTRTKNNVYLFTKIKNNSIFIKELLKKYRIKCYNV